MYNQLVAETPKACAPRLMTIRERMEDHKKSCEEQLAQINKALDLMNKYPEFETIHDAITKAGY